MITGRNGSMIGSIVLSPRVIYSVGIWYRVRLMIRVTTRAHKAQIVISLTFAGTVDVMRMKNLQNDNYEKKYENYT